MFHCPHCGEAVLDDDATSCPHCGSDDETGWNRDSEYYQVEVPDNYLDNSGEFADSAYDDTSPDRYSNMSRFRTQMAPARKNGPFIPPIFAFAMIGFAGLILLAKSKGAGQQGVLAILLLASGGTGFSICLAKRTKKSKPDS